MDTQALNCTPQTGQHRHASEADHADVMPFRQQLEVVRIGRQNNRRCPGVRHRGNDRADRGDTIRIGLKGPSAARAATRLDDRPRRR